VSYTGRVETCKLASFTLRRVAPLLPFGLYPRDADKRDDPVTLFQSTDQFGDIVRSIAMMQVLVLVRFMCAAVPTLPPQLPPAPTRI